MRYYGKEGSQCRLPIGEECSGVGRCRQAARAVLFGRVPRGVVLWLGLGIVATAITMGLLSVSFLGNGGRPHVSDVGSAISIRR